MIEELAVPSRDDRSYYATRAQRERIVAEEAADAKIAALHRELASRYAELAGEPDNIRQLHA